MRTLTLLRMLAPLVVAAAALSSPLAASADLPMSEIVLTIQLGAREEPLQGEEVGLAAYLIDPSGNPIAGEEVTFTVDDVFLNVAGQVEVGRVKTDETGLAAVVFEPRRAGENLVTASFPGNDVFEGARSTEKLTVASGPQLYRETTPFRIPGANVWMVTTIVGVVWGIYVVAMGFAVRIALSGDSE